MKRKIAFNIVLSDSFESIDYGYGVRFPRPTTRILYIPWFEIEFDWDSLGDVMSAAYKALNIKVAEEYPNMEYRIYYWTWLN